MERIALELSRLAEILEDHADVGAAGNTSRLVASRIRANIESLYARLAEMENASGH